MTANTKAIVTQLKQNPDFLSEVSEAMADALCVLILNSDNDNFDEKEIIDKLASTRLDLRKLVNN